MEIRGTCPVTGLPIFSKPEWTDVQLSPVVRMSFRIVGTSILDILTSGERSLASQEPYMALRDRVISEAFPNNRPYVELVDLAGLTGIPPSAVREKHTAHVTSKAYRNCVGCYVYNGSMIVRSIYRIGIVMQGRKLTYPLLLLKNYEEAARLAAKALGDLGGVGLQTMPLQLHEFEFKPEWTFKTDDQLGQIQFAIARGKILLMRQQGILKDLGTVARLNSVLENVFAEGLIRGPTYYRVGDYSELKYASMAVRKRYAQDTVLLHDKFSMHIRKTFIVGAAMWVRASLIFISRIISLNATYLSTIENAFSMVDLNEDYQYDLQRESNQKNSDQTSVVVKKSDLTELVRMLGTLAWDSVEEDKEHFPEGHPLSEASEAFRLVKEDYRSVLMRHQDAEQKAKAASKTKSEFLANMSHEIRTPMNGVLGMINLLLESELSNEQKSQAEIVRRSAENMLTLINDILDFSKVEAGKLELELTPFDMPALLSEFNMLMDARARAKGILYQCSNDLRIPTAVQGDPVRLRQVLTNLVGNAVKFTERGSVSLHVDLIESTASEAFLRFSIIDTGVGIPPEKVQVIFESFTQAEASTTRRFGGSGLGLAIARQLVQLMGGEIVVNSQVNVGSEFWFALRFAVVSVDMLQMPLSSVKLVSLQTMQLLKARVLIVEDNIINQKVAKGILQKFGCTCDIVVNGKEAVDILAKEKYDIVLMDCQMPVMDGYEATRIIRDPKSDVLNHTIPIVAMTANALVGDREKVLDVGMNDFVTKPVSMQKMREALERWIPE